MLTKNKQTRYLNIQQCYFCLETLIHERDERPFYPNIQGLAVSLPGTQKVPTDLSRPLFYFVSISLYLSNARISPYYFGKQQDKLFKRLLLCCLGQLFQHWCVQKQGFRISTHFIRDPDSGSDSGTKARAQCILEIRLTSSHTF